MVGRIDGNSPSWIFMIIVWFFNIAKSHSFVDLGKSEYLLFVLQAVWVLKSKIFGQRSTYSKKTTVFYEFNCWQFVKKCQNLIFKVNFQSKESSDLFSINTQYMTNPTIVSPVKMEYGWNFRISGLKMMAKSGLEKIFLKFLPAPTMSFLLLNLYFWSKFLLSMG